MQIRDEQKNPEKYQSEPKNQKSQEGKEKVIRRPAGDNWF
jgi:hypothetical protein